MNDELVEYLVSLLYVPSLDELVSFEDFAFDVLFVVVENNLEAFLGNS